MFIEFRVYRLQCQFVIHIYNYPMFPKTTFLLMLLVLLRTVAKESCQLKHFKMTV